MKKTVIKIIAVLLSAILGAAVFTSCEKTCEHEVTKWTIVREATCTTEGLRRGPCIICGDVLEETIPIDPENHVYGDWEITVLPTSEATGAGKAVKTCQENPEHTLEVTLPRITAAGTGYLSSEVTKEATVLSEGERTFVYAHEEGNITFTLPIEKKKFDPTSDTAISDAVLLAASNKSLIRGGQGSKDAGTGVVTIFNYLYGDNYTYIMDYGDDREYWLSVASDGDIFAVWRDGVKAPEEWGNAKLDDMDGYAYMISFAGYTRFYGAEGLLRDSYAWGKSKNNNGDFKEYIDATGEKVVYHFSFGYYSAPEYFCNISVEFTLNEDYALDYIKLSSAAYRKDSFTVTSDADGNGICTVNAGAKAFYNEYVEYNQTTVAESPEVPVNPYGENSLKVSGFDLQYGDYILSEDVETSPEFVADRLYQLSINNIQPSTADFSYDPVTVYQITDSGSRVVLSYVGTDNNVIAFYSQGSITFKSHQVGNITLLFRTASGYEKKFTVKVTPIEPTALYPAIYEYGDTGYIWRNYASTIAETSVYVGQSLTFTANVASAQSTYADPEYEAILAGASGATKADATVTSTGEGSDIITEFVAAKPGIYTVHLRSVRNISKYATIRVTVEEPPALDTILTGSYTGKINYPSKSDVTIVFKTGEDGALTAEVTTNKGTEVLSVVYDEEYGELITEHIDGASLGIALTINEAWRLVIVNPTGFGSGKERLVVYRVEQEPSQDADTPLEEETPSA